MILVVVGERDLKEDENFVGGFQAKGQVLTNHLESRSGSAYYGRESPLLLTRIVR